MDNLSFEADRWEQDRRANERVNPLRAACIVLVCMGLAILLVVAVLLGLGLAR